ncbi:hypothetical protein OG552_09660 [Streptomyces sp. NBC_01476]|uniref:hypothetical protein n=1 Tax=Streptomyces sp. NBC_01476 TaxID=2903881 RepID=UPI002E34EEE0|nr:hypothetical protein [Streptomyces sp. NBC_01476]
MTRATPTRHPFGLVIPRAWAQLPSTSWIHVWGTLALLVHAAASPPYTREELFERLRNRLVDQVRQLTDDH